MAILAALAAGLVDVDPIVRAISTSFVAVYVAATAAGVRLLDGRLRAAAALSLALVVVVLAFSGPYVAAPGGLSRCSRSRSSVPVRVAQLGGELQAQLIVVQRRSLEEVPASRSGG